MAIGVHVGLLLALLFAGVFTMQAYKANNDPVCRRTLACRWGHTKLRGSQRGVCTDFDVPTA